MKTSNSRQTLLFFQTETDEKRFAAAHCMRCATHASPSFTTAARSTRARAYRTRTVRVSSSLNRPRAMAVNEEKIDALILRLHEILSLIHI